MRKLFYLFLILFVSIGSQLAAQTGIDVPELKSVDSLVKAFMAKYDVPGGQVAITRKGKLIYNRGFGFADTANHVLVSPSNLFRIASCTKPITSAALMILYQNGLVNLDQNVFGPGGILDQPYYDTILDPRVKEVTVRELLYHTGGWDRDISGDPMFDQVNIANTMHTSSPPDSITIIRYELQYKMLDHDPGTYYAYSNFGYLILGRVIEKISGMRYADYVQQNVLQPAGITDMQLGFNLASEKYPNEVYYYDYPGAPLASSVYNDGTFVPWPYGGFNIQSMDSHGEWIASAEDLVKFVTAVDSFPSRPDILSASTIHTMVTPSAQNQNYAFGWAVNIYDNWWHQGSVPGASSEIVRTPYDSAMTWALVFNFRPADIYSNVFSSDMDNLIWNAIANITIWPTGDQFGTETLATTVTNQSIEIFPNPASNFLQLHAEGLNTAALFYITDENGKIVRQGTLAGDSSAISVSGLPKGFYCLTLVNENKASSAKFMKQ